MKKLLLLLLPLLLLSCNNISSSSSDGHNPDEIYDYVPEEIVKEAYRYCRNHNYNTDICVFVNFSITSDMNRFFVYDFDDREILIKSFCAHGYGKGSTPETPVFSNEVGSYCSSIGKYVISGYRKMVRIDENCFELKGLDSTNSNAYRRGILIHPSYLVDLCQFSNGVSYIPLGLTSQGCFSINHNALEELAKLYQAQTNKRVLLYAFTTE